jgi:uncharacterized membrane protein YhiD involved in acid resistance
MRGLIDFQPTAFVGALVSLATAFCLGGLIGFERQYRQRSAGLRTNVLAAVGACAGAGRLAEALAITAFVLAGNTLLRPVVNYLNRRPISERDTEVIYRVHVVCDPSDVSEARNLLFSALEAANYPIQDIETPVRGRRTGGVGRDPGADHRRTGRVGRRGHRVGGARLHRQRHLDREHDGLKANAG